MIEVLWIDDQHKEEAMTHLVIAAENEAINLNGYASYEEGFEVLERNLDRFDCILLDGMFFKKKDQEKGTEDTTGIGAAINRIHQLSREKFFPWFVLSGKDKFTSGSNDLLEANEVECYDKTNPADVDRLFEVIKQTVEKQESFQIRTKYADILEVLQDKFLGNAQFARIYNVLESIEKNEPIASHFNGIRMVLEGVFEHLGTIGLVPDTLVKEGSLNRTSLFLSGKNRHYTPDEQYVHPLFADNVFRLLSILQDGSHDKEGLRLKVHDYLRTNSSHYFQRSVAFLFLDVLSGFLTLVKEHPNRDNNLNFWTAVEDFSHDAREGEITNMAANGFITLKDQRSGEEISFPEHVVNSAILPNIKIGSRVSYKLKAQQKPNGKKYVESILVKDQ